MRSATQFGTTEIPSLESAGGLARLDRGGGDLWLCRPARLGCFPPSLRATIENRIEELIDLLDRLDGDPDLELLGDELEPDGDETDQSFPEWGGPWFWRHGISWNYDLGAEARPDLACLEDSEMDDLGGTYGID